MAVPWQWYVLASLRLLWTVLPQNGYIHPDEFFQSVEIVAGDVLNLEVHRSWEFNHTAPIRSMTLPYLVFSPSFYFLKTLNLFGATNSLISPYFLLIMPRISVASLSILTDMMVYRLAAMLGVNSRNALFTYSTSFLPFVFFTRTFSNTIETFLFISLVYFITKSFSRNEMDKRKGQGHGSCFTSTIAVIIVTGVFNRPTFVAFALVPYILWLTGGNLSSWRKDKVTIFRKGFGSVTAALSVTTLFVLFDSLYYGSLVTDLGSLLTAYDQMGIYGIVSTLTITPINFLLYNTHGDNLAEHGIHPRLTHLCVNAPVLFNILAISALASIGKHLQQFATRPWGSLVSTVHGGRFEGVLLLCYLVPLILLSLFPHQEARFLLPLVYPLVLLYSDYVYGKRAKWNLTLLWLVLNVLAGVVFGVLHQGGMIPGMQHLHHLQQQERLKGRDSVKTSLHYVFYHTYMPPQHLLALSSLHGDRDTTVAGVCGRVTVHDLMGSSHSHLLRHLQDMTTTMIDSQCHFKIYIIAPATVDNSVKLRVSETQLTVRLDHSFCPHVSMENLPKLDSVLPKRRLSSIISYISIVIKNVSRLLCLNIYRVETRQ